MIYSINIEDKDIIDILTDKNLKYFIKSHYDLDHIVYKKYDYINTVIVE
jgi:hypothetical protein